MRLGKDGQDWIRLGLVGYQFPDAEDVRKRCSWHVVEGEASCREGAWQFKWQALTCEESDRFTEWLRMAADWVDGKDWFDGEVSWPPYWVPAGTDFTEPNLSFSVNRNRDATGLVIVALNMEFRPPWRAPSRTFETPTILHIHVDPPTLRRAADEWAAEVAKYPDNSRSS